MSFLAGRRSFRTTDERNRPLLAERVAARVYLCSPATNNRVRLRVYFPAHGEYEVSAVAAVGDLLCRFHVYPSPSGKPQATARGLRGTAGSFRCDPQCCAISADDCLLIAGKQTWSAGLRIVALAIVRARGLNL